MERKTEASDARAENRGCPAASGKSPFKVPSRYPKELPDRQIPTSRMGSKGAAAKYGTTDSWPT